ncbi:hypothetical protein PQE74_gp114 [Bacillus phage vB_BanS_Chewbecca]|uniref:Uncharacterized protein n=4 Tax=Caudoviricetes TaxID=2731619 RepID=A0AAE8YYK8_9CAUD|nr:hypothetical protein PQE72_gp139 [Bacillus phage vB_BanS_Skywalker]YP_010681017.1 hypothetical protein PQE73_gp121 [Bacillus phage vB_BanS_MrDarsey]YP_010681257.1 hypothetical protein PQE74_gp114 [Bacillus phage vB_BanS_Chewbecca]UGO46197.1 hypothetical protein CHEWBECCA_114 [Bacillus phage vB_BanS_Chewbecca]UGO47953.1 hypothetical protein MRDARSEY_121 [Bacillus phage vB_BanS_MrDarsey]UGO51304.1 hypothetical protein SKYWALKER_147 [Bacillus phage vB_BanS_Skywalker]
MKEFSFRIAKKRLPDTELERTVFNARLLDNGKWRVEFYSRVHNKDVTYDYKPEQVLRSLADRDWILVEDGDIE